MAAKKKAPARRRTSAKRVASRKSASRKPPAPRQRRPRPAQSPIAKQLQEASLRAGLDSALARHADAERAPFTFPGIPHVKKRAFLAAYAECGNVRMAAESANIDRKTHTNWLKDDDLYVEAFEAARNHAMDLLEQEAWRRARSGVDEPVFQMGELCGTVRKYSDTLLIFLMKGGRKEVYADRHELTGVGGGPIETKDTTSIDLTKLSDEELDVLERIGLQARKKKPKTH